MGYIYKIWNEVNDKVYIGQTTYSLQKRWKEHLYASKNEKARTQNIYLAMRKYGQQFFHIEEIEQCENDLLNEREMYWVEYFDSYRNGYNMTLGGLNLAQVKNILTEKQVQCIYDLWDDGFAIIDIIRLTDFTSAQVRGKLVGYKNYSLEEAIQRGRAAAKKTKSKKITQWTLLGEKVCSYDSGLEAEEKTGINRKAISKVLNGNGKTAGGYLWTFNEDLPEIEPQEEKIYQYDNNGILVGVYNSYNEAGRATGIDPSAIGKVCRGQRKTAKGFIWQKK